MNQPQHRAHATATTAGTGLPDLAHPQGRDLELGPHTSEEGLMFRIRFTLDIGRRPEEPDPEIVPDLTDGGAQVEDAGYGSAQSGWTGAGFGLPDHSDDGG